MIGAEDAMLTAGMVGIALALGTVAIVRLVGFEQRTFYSAVTFAVAHYYLLFAIMAGDLHALTTDGAIALVFVGLAIVGFKRNLLMVALALILHGLLDVGHSALVSNAGTPIWWPSFCSSYDFTAGVVLAWQVRQSRVARTLVS